MIKVIIIDDEKLFVSQLEIMSQNLGFQVVGTFYSTKGVQDFLEKNEVDIIFLDINLSNEISLPFAHELIDENIPIVFITQYDDYDLYQKTLEIPFSSFLVKPFHQFTLDRTVKLLLAQVEDTQTNYIRDGRNRIMLKHSDILWIRVEGNYSYIKTKEKQLVFKKSLAQIKRVLPLKHFIQVHRNYIVPLAEVSKINMTDNILYLHEEKIPISRRFKVNILKQIRELL